MIDYSKKSKEHLFLIFLLGGLFGFLDTGKFEIGSFVGSGLGMMLISVAIGYIIHLIIGKIRTNKGYDSNSVILDSDLEGDKLQVLEEKLVNKLQPFKYGIFVSLFFVLMTIFNEIWKYIF